MRIRSITLHGFKSFGNRTTLELSERVSVIAGPNGSGKSNVVDALRWATGGGRASEFRAGEKTELIFHGATGKRSVGFAEVEVEVELAEGKVSVQRTLQRDGTGRLRLNGRNARFLDIDDALTGTGLGKGSLAIIGQGEISGVLMADPGRLLAFVAEAAGVARLAGRFEQAGDRLARARDHMARLQDLHDELQRLLDRLRLEAADAGSHSELSRESLLLQFTLAQLRRESLEKELLELAGQEQQLEASVRAVGSDRDLLAEDLAQDREDHNRLQEQYRADTARVEAWKGEIRLSESRLQTIRDRIHAGRQQAGALRLEISRLESESEPAAPEGSTEALEAELGRLETVLNGLHEQRSALAARDAEARELLTELELQARQRQEQLAHWQARRSALTEQLEQVKARLLGDEFAPVPDDGSDAEFSELETDTAREQGLQEKLRTRLQEAQEEHATALGHVRSLETALARLRSAMEARSGFAEGPRLALASGLPGIHGAVADLIELDEEYRSAIAAAMGNRSEYIVVESADHGKAIIAFVRERGGYVTVLPLDLMRERNTRPDGRLLAAAGVRGTALSNIRFPDRYGALFSQLLCSTLLLDDLDAAVRLARAFPDRPRLVTMAGEILDAGGAMSGGKRTAGAYLLGQAAELRQLEADTLAALQAAEEARETVSNLQDDYRAGQARLKEASGRLDELASARARRREQAAVREHLHSELSARSGQLEAELRLLNSQEPVGEVDQETLAQAAAAAEQTSRELDSLNTSLTEAATEEAEARSQLRLHQERHSSWQAALQRYRHDRDRLGQLQQDLATLDHEFETLNGALTDGDRELQQLKESPPADLADLELQLQEARLQLRSLEERHRAAGSELAVQREQLERVRMTMARRETMLQAAVEEAGRFPPGLERLEGSERNLRARLQEVSRELEGLGPVNHRAAAELEQESLRAHQLAADLLDAENAATELQKSLEEVDAEVSARSEEAIAAVRTAFLDHVQELFGPEAEAGIETLREEGRPSGLAIRLQPPGKRTTQLNLLSVGERTMGALAFLFALMDGAGNEGLPIAVLDEVDAPLDEANIARFTTFVERLAARGTQFLLISHQKTTFSIADAMWGITSDRGVSSVFSISRNESALEQGTA